MWCCVFGWFLTFLWILVRSASVVKQLEKTSGNAWPLKMEVPWFFRALRITHPATQRHIPDLNPWHGTYFSLFTAMVITLYLKHLASNKIAVRVEYGVLCQYVVYVPLKWFFFFILSVVLISETTVFSEMWVQKKSALSNHTHTYLLTYSMEQSPSREANWFCSQLRNSPHFMESESSLPYSQAPANCPS